MREDLLAAPTMTPGLEALDREFEDVFATWFNAGAADTLKSGPEVELSTLMYATA